MKRTFLLSLAIACLSVTVLPALPAAAHDAPRRCRSKEGVGAGWFKLRGHQGIRCPKARKLAQRWENKCVWNQDCPGDIDHIKNIKPGFKCRQKQVAYETVRVRCTATTGSGVVHFRWGS